MIRARIDPRAAFAAACVALAVLLIAAGGAGAEVVVHYKKESPQEFNAQLARHEVAAATFNKKVRSIRLTLKDGSHVLVRYDKGQSGAEEARLKAAHVPVTVLSGPAANKELKAKPKHHKIRYIVAAVLVAVIVIVGAVLLVNRRRRRDY